VNLCKMVELNILKLDLDIQTKDLAIDHLFKLFSYATDIGFLKINKIKKIELVKKTTYGARIYLKFDLKNLNNVVMLQSIFGSDPLKEMNVLINHHKLNMIFSNRIFDIKRYPDGSYKFSKLIDITNIIFKKVKDEQRKRWNN